MDLLQSHSVDMRDQGLSASRPTTNSDQRLSTLISCSLRAVVISSNINLSKQLMQVQLLCDKLISHAFKRQGHFIIYYLKNFEHVPVLLNHGFIILNQTQVGFYLVKFLIFVTRIAFPVLVVNKHGGLRLTAPKSKRIVNFYRVIGLKINDEIRQIR